MASNFSPMQKLISDFTTHLKESLAIGNSITFHIKDENYSNILICGLGGSGIGGTIISQVLKPQCKLPIVVNKDYSIPGFVDKNTLVIACSYSGNTEETLEMVEAALSKNAEVCVITSGGKFSDIAAEKQLNIVQIPGNLPPRAAFGYSFPQLFFVLEKYGLIGFPFQDEIKKAIELLDVEEISIQQEAAKIADSLLGKIPVIYSESRFEGVAIRFRQQINENSKMLCWHHAIPEMNHNELVGWRNKNENLVPVFITSNNDYFRNTERVKYSQKIISEYVGEMVEMKAKGETYLIECLYLIHLGDWVSWYLADKKKIDAMEVDVITGLKEMLGKI